MGVIVLNQHWHPFYTFAYKTNEKYKTSLSIRIGSLSSFYTFAYKTNEKYKTSLSLRMGSLTSFYIFAIKSIEKYNNYKKV